MVEGGRHSNGVTVSFRRRLTGSVVNGFEQVTYGDWFDVEDCAVKYGLSDSSEDHTAARDMVEFDAIVYAPPMDEPPGEFDLARLPDDDDEYKVDGRPIRWDNPFRKVRVGTEIHLNRSTG